MAKKPSTKQIVVFHRREATGAEGFGALWLTGVHRNGAGVITNGFVENGGWRYQFEDGTVFVKDHRDEIVNRVTGLTQEIVEVDVTVSSYFDDYNKVILAAEATRAASSRS